MELTPAYSPAVRYGRRQSDLKLSHVVHGVVNEQPLTLLGRFNVLKHRWIFLLPLVAKAEEREGR